MTAEYLEFVDWAVMLFNIMFWGFIALIVYEIMKEGKL